MWYYTDISIEMFQFCIPTSQKGEMKYLYIPLPLSAMTSFMDSGQFVFLNLKTTALRFCSLCPVFYIEENFIHNDAELLAQCIGT